MTIIDETAINLNFKVDAKGLKAIENSLNNVSKSFLGINTRVSRFKNAFKFSLETSALVGIAAIFYKITQAIIDLNLNLMNTSLRLNLPASKVLDTQTAFKSLGVQGKIYNGIIDNLNESLNKSNPAKLSDFMSKVSKAQNLTGLNFNVNDNQGKLKTPKIAFNDLLKGISLLSFQKQITALTTIFGSAGKSLLPITRNYKEYVKIQGDFNRASKNLYQKHNQIIEQFSTNIQFVSLNLKKLAIDFEIIFNFMSKLVNFYAGLVSYVIKHLEWHKKTQHSNTTNNTTNNKTHNVINHHHTNFSDNSLLTHSVVSY